MKKILSMLIPLMLVACATDYQPQGFSGGYSSMQVADDMYQVTFKGNAYTSEDQVHNYLLRRCAEITVQKGYRFFLITNQNEINNQSVSHSTDSINNYYYESDTHIQNRYANTVIIKLLNNKEKYPNALDAEVILRNFQKTN